MTAHFRLTLTLLLGAWMLNASAQDAASVAVKAKELLAEKKTDTAIELLEAAQREGKQNSELAFLRGVAYQQRAMHAKDSAAQAQASREAEAAYNQAKRPAPPTNLTVDGAPATATFSAAALNNLAALYASSGNDAQARAHYEQAIATKDPRRGYYALNYARYLESRDANKAIEMARLASQAAPQSNEARDYLGELLWRHRIGDMLPYAVDLVQRGHTQAASEWAIKCLNAGNRPTDERRAWLVLLARNAATTVRYQEPDSQLRETLAALRADADIGRGATELGEMLFTTRANAQSLSWWRDTRAIASLQTTPRDTMRELLRATADSLLSDPDKGNDRTAERYLMAAIEMGAHGPDPENFLRLVELYVNQDAHLELTRAMERYENDLFSEKSWAYQQEDWQLIYRMHLALGMTYAHLNAWESSQQFRNALFQLDAAQKAADRLNRDAERKGKPERVALPPIAVAKLAEGYAKINRPELAFKTRVDGAANLQKVGFTRESAQLLEAIPADQLQRAAPTTRTQIERMKSVAMEPR